MNYKVIRWCCTSGNCINCHDLKYGTKRRVMQLDKLTKEKATIVADNFREYGAEIIEDTSPLDSPI